MKISKKKLLIPIAAITFCITLIFTTLAIVNNSSKEVQKHTNIAEIPKEVRDIVDEKMKEIERSKPILEGVSMSQDFGDTLGVDSESMYIDENGNYVIEGNEQLLFVDIESEYNVTGVEKKVEVIIPLDEEIKANEEEILVLDSTLADDIDITLTSSGGSHSGYNSDSSGSVRLYLTVSYVTYTSGGMNLMYIQNVSGSVSAGGSGSNVGSGVSLKSNYVQLIQNGMSNGSGYKYQNTYFSHSAGTRSWQHSAPSSWYAVEYDTAASNIGGIFTVTLGRGSSTWSANVNVHVDNGGY